MNIHIMNIWAPINGTKLTFAIALAEPTDTVGPYCCKYELKPHTVPDIVGTTGVVAGFVGVKMAVDMMVCPLMMVVKVKGVGAPAVAVVGAGWPTGPCGLPGVVVVNAAVVVVVAVVTRGATVDLYT
jgi:hypothetical protein